MRIYEPGSRGWKLKRFVTSTELVTPHGVAYCFQVFYRPLNKGFGPLAAPSSDFAAMGLVPFRMSSFQLSRTPSTCA